MMRPTARAHCGVRLLIAQHPRSLCPFSPHPQASPTFCHEGGHVGGAPSPEEGTAVEGTVAVGVLPSRISFVQLQSAPVRARADKQRDRAHKQRRLRSNAPAHKKKVRGQHACASSQHMRTSPT
jgi:hypothetical protein